MEPPLRSWDALPEELVLCIGARIRTLKSYVAARGVCTVWRSELPPLAASPCLLLAGKLCPTVYSLPMRRPFGLAAHHTGYRYVGSSGGWLAVTYRSGTCHGEDLSQERNRNRNERSLLGNTKKREQDPLRNRQAKDFYYRNFDGAEIRMQPHHFPEIQKSGRDKWRVSLLNPVTGKHIVLPEHAKLDPHDVTKVAFAPHPSVHDYTVVVAYGTGGGLAYISTRDAGGRREWSFGAIAGVEEEVTIADVVHREGRGDGGDKVYCLLRNGDVHVLHVPRGSPTRPFTVPLVPELAGRPFDPYDVFPLPHARFSHHFTSMGGKNLVLCGGELYQVWRNTLGGRFQVNLPGGGGSFSVPKDEVFVLRYDPWRQPCWVPETDLGGHAVFIGPASSAMAVRADCVPGLRADCAYWVGRCGDGPAMVFDVTTRQSTPCIAPSSAARGQPICWLSLGNEVERL